MQKGAIVRLKSVKGPLLGIAPEVNYEVTRVKNGGGAAECINLKNTKTGFQVVDPHDGLSPADYASEFFEEVRH